MKWTIKLEFTPDGGETISREIGSMTGPVADLSPEEIGLTLAEGHELVRDIERRMISDRYGVSQRKGADTFFDRYKIFFIVGLLNVTAVAAGFGLGRSTPNT